jgi:hypothetical protein
MSMVTKEDWQLYMPRCKSQCIFVAKGLIIELDKRFLVKELMNVTNIIYAQYGV